MVEKAKPEAVEAVENHKAKYPQFILQKESEKK